MSSTTDPAKRPKAKIALATNVFGHVKTALELAEAALRGIGIPGVEAIPAIPLKIIAIYENVKASKEDMDDLLDHLEVLEQVILAPILAEKAKGRLNVPQDLLVRVGELTRKLTECENAIEPLAEQKTRHRFAKQSRISETLKDTNRSISQAITALQLGGQVTGELLLRRLQTDVGVVKSLVQTQEDQSFLSKLIPANDASFRASQKTECLPGTRTSLLASISDHLPRRDVGLVSLYGSPGTGKSAVAKSVAAQAHKQQLLAASYFFDKRGGYAPPETFVSAIAYQFSSISPTFKSLVVAQLRRDPLLSTANAEERLEHLFLDPLISLPAPDQPFIIVLDALDECGDQDQRRRFARLLRRMTGTVQLRRRVIFFLTSRPETAITSILERDSSSSASDALHMDEQDARETQADIETFVKARFEQILEETIVESDMPSSQAIEGFAALSAGLFELAAVRLRQVQSQCHDRAVSLSEAVYAVLLLSRPSSSSIDSNNPLHDVYREILGTVYDQAERSTPLETLRRWFQDVVGAIACAREPLNVTTLCALVGIEERDARTAMQPLSSVIMFPAKGAARFYHVSFLEFVLSSPPKGGLFPDDTARYLIDQVQSDTALARRSFLIMNDSLRQNILDLPKPSVFNADIPNLPEVLSDKVPEHLQYACRHWALHLRAEDMFTCRGLFVSWCEQKLLFYLEVLSLMGEMERAVPLLVTAEDWARGEVDGATPSWVLFIFLLLRMMLGAPDLAPTATLLNDCQRLVQMFHPAITRSAGALYTSAIPFMPSCNLHEQYSHLADEGMVLVRGRLSAWPAQIWAAGYPRSQEFVAFSPDGRRIASGSADRIIRLLSARTGQTEQLMKGHTDWVRSVAFSPDGARIVSGSDDRTVRIWCAASGVQERVLEGHTGHVSSVALSPDGARIVSGSEDRTVRIWCAASGVQERVLEGHTRSVSSVVFSPDGMCLVSGSHDCSVRIWSAASGEQERLLEGHTDWLHCTALSSDGAWIVSGSADATIRIWNATSGEQVQVLKGHIGDVHSVAFSPDGAHIVSGSVDRTIRIWSVASGEQERVLEGHTRDIYSIACCPDGARIVSASDDRTVRMWFAASGDQERVLEGHTRPVSSVHLYDDRTIMCTDYLGGTMFWDVNTGHGLDQNQPRAQSYFSEFTGNRFTKHGWWHFNNLSKSVWVPNYIRGKWWYLSRAARYRGAMESTAAHNMVIMDSEATPGRLAFIKLSD